VNEYRHIDRVVTFEISRFTHDADAVCAQHARHLVGNDRRPFALPRGTEIAPVLGKSCARGGTSFVTGRDQHVGVDECREHECQHARYP
jgi:hypothetical protein